jgi:hypothetical protein
MLIYDNKVLSETCIQFMESAKDRGDIGSVQYWLGKSIDYNKLAENEKKHEKESTPTT